MSEAMRLLRGLRADGRALTVAEHLAAHGALATADVLSPDAIVAIAEAAGVRGRGGGGYPLAAKLRAVRAAPRSTRSPIVVVNAAESEPSSRKDHLLLTRTPHLVLDGAELAARAIGAHEIVVRVHASPDPPDGVASPSMSDAVAVALTERGSGSRLRVRIEAAPPRYVAGEASAVVGHLSGHEAVPRMKPPRLAHRGVDGRPTLVSNVETLAQLRLAVAHGPAWFRTVGPADEPGTMLVTLLGALARPGVVEAPVASTVGQLVAACGGVTSMPSAVLVGGYGGCWVRPDQAVDVAVSHAGLRLLGGRSALGLVAVLPAESCVVAETARLVRWLASQGAGQCGPCVNGLPALADACAALAAGGGAATAPALLGRWAAMVDGRGACHHPDGVAVLVRSLLSSFAAQVASHAAGEKCLAGNAPSVLAAPAARTRTGTGTGTGGTELTMSDRAEQGQALLQVDWIRCDKQGLCMELLPELITPDDWGYPMVAGPVPPHLRKLAERARTACPSMALRLTT